MTHTTDDTGSLAMGDVAHRADIEPHGSGCRAACPCGWRGQERSGSELAIHEAEQHVRALTDAPADDLRAGGEG